MASTQKVDLVRSLGADHVIDYTHADITDDGQRYDLVLDIGGNRPLSQLRRVLTRDGTLVIVGGEGGGRWTGGIHRQLGAMVAVALRAPAPRDVHRQAEHAPTSTRCEH